MALVNVWLPLFLPSATNKSRLPLKFGVYDIFGNYMLAHPNLMKMPSSLKTVPCLLSFRHQNYLLIIHEYEEKHLKGIFNIFLLKIESKL